MADALLEWWGDFCGRMLEGSEKTVFSVTPWRQDQLAKELIGRGRFAVYALGYCGGYMVEQVAVTLATDGTLKLGGLAVKTAVKSGTRMVAGRAFQVSIRAHLSKKIVAGEVDELLFHAVNRSLSTAAKTPLPGTQKTALDAVYDGLQHAGARYTSKEFLDDALTRPRIKALILQEGAEGAFLHRFGQFCHFMGGELDEQLTKNFVKAFDEKLIVSGPNGSLRDFANEFLLSFKGQPQLLGNAATKARLEGLASSTEIDRAAVKAAFQDGGSVWSIDNVVTPEMPVAAVRRGVVCETAYYYHHRWADGWLRDATVRGIDWWKGSVVEQFKTMVNPTLDQVKGFLRAMLQPGRAVGGNTFMLDVRVPPGSTLDRNAFKVTVDQYIATEEFRSLVRPGEKVFFKIDVYDFHPN